MPEVQAIKILVVDHHSVVASGISAVLKEFADFVVVGQAQNGEETLQLIESHSPDVVAMDVDLPGQMSGIDLIHTVHSKSPRTRILILTNLLEDVLIHNVLQAGIAGYLLKKASAKELASAIRAAHQGIATFSPEVTQIMAREFSAPFRNGYKLTPREYEVLELIAQGQNNTEIASILGVSVSTVQFHVSNILSKLGVHNRIEATAYAIRHKLAD